MRLILGILIFSIFISCQENRKAENKEEQKSAEKETLKVLLVGTFHFENFNPENNGDLVQKKISDVLTSENQKELELIAERISEFNPSKIFVEYPFERQGKLDTIYQNFPNEANFKNQTRDEIKQIGFRVAKQLKHNKVFAMDLKTNFPYDSLLTQMKKAKQFDLIRRDEMELKELEKSAKELFNSNKSLSEIIFFYNQQDYRNSDINWYLSLANQGGERGNFVGSYLASEWYRRNLHMYSIIQKSIEKNDERIMILAGSSHVSMFKNFIDYNPEWKTVELEEIMK